MKRKEIIFIVLSLFIFLSLVYYNYLRAQQQISQVRETQFQIALTRKPEVVAKNVPVTLEWQVTAPESFAASQTILYWGYDSTPSALVKTDNPDAVRYPFSTPDYSQGYFRLPDHFDVNITFPKTGKVYYRAYARIGNDNLWTAEQSLIVQ